MRSLLILSCVLLACLSSCTATSLNLGTTYNTRLIWQQKVEYSGILFKKRVKEVFYTDPAQQIIRGIVARDLENSQAIATVTAGGIGFSYVNLRFKSERGSGLNYQVEIFV